jgi:hypothetical protein
MALIGFLLSLCVTAVAADDDGARCTKSDVGPDVDAKLVMLQMQVEEHGNNSRGASASEFQDPWEGYADWCINSSLGYNAEMWGTISKWQPDSGMDIPQFFAAYHCTERLWTLKNVMADPVGAANVLPTRHSDAELAMLIEMAKSKKNMLDSKIQAMFAHVSSVGGAPGHESSSVHFADMENGMRQLLGLPSLPEDTEFVYNTWYKLLVDYASRYSLRFGGKMEDASVHSFCAQRQIEDVRKTLLR